MHQLPVVSLHAASMVYCILHMGLVVVDHSHRQSRVDAGKLVALIHYVTRHQQDTYCDIYHLQCGLVVAHAN